MVRWSLRLKINLTVNVLVYCVLTTVFTFYYFCIFDFLCFRKLKKPFLIVPTDAGVRSERDLDAEAQDVGADDRRRQQS